MKLTELRQIIREEISKTLNEPTISVEDAKEYAESFDDDDVLSDFDKTFSGHKEITKPEFVKFFKDYIDDVSEMKYIHAAWKKLLSGEGLY